MLKPREEGVPVSPYTNMSGFCAKSFLSSGFVFNLSLILPPPFHQQNLNKVVLSGVEGFPLSSLDKEAGRAHKGSTPEEAGRARMCSTPSAPGETAFGESGDFQAGS